MNLFIIMFNFKISIFESKKGDESPFDDERFPILRAFASASKRLCRSDAPAVRRNGHAADRNRHSAVSAQHPGCDTARDICTYRQLKPALVSLYVENLVQSGHLRRESVPEDRRKCRLLLTAQALPVVEKGLALQAAFTAQMFAGLSKEDLASGQRCLAAVTQNIQTINQKGSA